MSDKRDFYGFDPVTAAYLKGASVICDVLFGQVNKPSQDALLNYDSWRTRTPKEYDPPKEQSQPDPDAEREEWLDRQVERDREAGVGTNEHEQEE